MQLYPAVSDIILSDEKNRSPKTGKGKSEFKNFFDLHINNIHINVDWKHHRTCNNIRNRNNIPNRHHKPRSNANQLLRHLAEPAFNQHHRSNI